MRSKVNKWRFWFSPHRKTQETFSLEFQKIYISYICYKVDSYSESEIQTSMVTHTLNSCSTFTHPSAHIQQWTHTHREHTPGAVGSYLCCGARRAVGGSVPCSRAPRRGIEGRERAGHSLPPPTVPAGPRVKLATFQLWVRLSTIRPRLIWNVTENSYFVSWTNSLEYNVPLEIEKGNKYRLDSAFEHSGKRL